MFCQTCGTEIGNNDIFCPNCGSRIAEYQPTVVMGQQPVAVTEQYPAKAMPMK